MRRAPLTAVVLVAVGCWPALPKSSEGFACQTDGDCLGGTRCVAQVCRFPGEPDGGADAGTDAGYRFDGGACAGSSSLTNLVGNGSFETDTAGWEGYPTPADGALIRTSPGLSGNGAARVTRTSAASEFGVNDKPNWVSSTAGPGKTLCVLAWARGSDPAGKLRLRVREYTAGGTQSGDTRSSTLELADGQWHPLATELVTSGPAGGKLDLQIELLDPTSGTAWLEVDDVSMRQLP